MNNENIITVALVAIIIVLTFSLGRVFEMEHYKFVCNGGQGK